VLLLGSRCLGDGLWAGSTHEFKGPLIECLPSAGEFSSGFTRSCFLVLTWRREQHSKVEWQRVSIYVRSFDAETTSTL